MQKLVEEESQRRKLETEASLLANKNLSRKQKKKKVTDCLTNGEMVKLMNDVFEF